MKVKSQFNCSDCEVNTSAIRESGYMLKSEIWLSIAGSSDILCIGCLEKRLNRRLQPADFTNHPINKKNLRNKSARLLNRLTLTK